MTSLESCLVPVPTSVGTAYTTVFGAAVSVAMTGNLEGISIYDITVKVEGSRFSQFISDTTGTVVDIRAKALNLVIAAYKEDYMNHEIEWHQVPAVIRDLSISLQELRGTRSA